MHKAGESIRSVEDVSQSLFKPLTLYLLCARVKPFLRSGGGGGVVLAMAAGVGHVAWWMAHTTSSRRGKAGTAWPKHIHRWHFGLGRQILVCLLDCSYGRVCGAGLAVPVFRASQSIEGIFGFTHI